LSAGKAEGAQAITLRGEVHAVELLGHERIVYLRTEGRMVEPVPGGIGSSEGLLAARLTDGPAPSLGETLTLRANAGNIHWFDAEGTAVEAD